MRGGIADLPTPHPIAERLPGVYVDDDFTQRFTAALDQVLAPVFAVLDSFPSYLDPAIAPDDFVDWLADWVALGGLEGIDEHWTAEQRRELVSQAVDLHRWRGTRRGLVALVRTLTGGSVEVIDSGGCTASDQPNAPLPGSDHAGVRVQVRVSDPASVDQRRLRAAVVDAAPAHVSVTLDVLPMIGDRR